MKKLKKVLASIMAATVSAVSFCSVLHASAATVKYDTYRYYFDAPANTYIKTCNANMSYNPTTTTYAGSSTGDLGGTFSVNDVGVTSTLRKNYVEYSNSSPNSSSGYLGYVTVKTTSSAPTFSITQVTNDRDNSLVTSTVAISRVLMGDVDLDGEVSIEDVQLLSQCLMGTASMNTTQARAADVNGDGTINSADTLCITKYLSGINDSVMG